jgi:hypothetical protein
MTRVNAIISGSPPTNVLAKQPVDWRLEQLIDRLPVSLRSKVRWLRKPSSRWARIPAGALLILGGLLSILRVLGLWMLPLGLALLAEDAPPLRRARDRLLDWIERRWPNLLSGAPRSRRPQSLLRTVPTREWSGPVQEKARFRVTGPSRKRH